MKITFDEKLNLGYIYFKEDMKEEVFETIEVNDEMNLDVAKDGTVIGIELLNAKEQLNFKKSNILKYQNLNTHVDKELVLV